MFIEYMSKSVKMRFLDPVTILETGEIVICIKLFDETPITK